MATQENFILKFATVGVENIKQAGRAVSTLSEKVDGLTSALAGLSFGALIASAARYADAVKDVSDATNLSIASILALQQAYDQAGGSGQDVGKSLNYLYGVMDQGLKGSDEARDAFDRVGVSLNDLKTLSEADIFNRVVKGLSEMPPGAERSAAAIKLLGKAMQTIDPTALREAINVEDQKKNEEAVRAASEAVGQLEDAFRELQLAAARLLTPIAKLLGESKFNAEAADKAVRFMAVAFGLAFGAKMVTSIVALNRALGITAGLTNLIGKSPLGLIAKLGLAVTGGLALEAAIDKLVGANEELGASADKAGEAQADALTPPTPGGQIEGGAAGAPRKSELSAREKAIIASDARIEQARRAEALANSLAIAGDRRRIELQSANDLENAIAQIRANTALDSSQQNKEIRAREAEFAAKKARELGEFDKNIAKEVAAVRLGYEEQNAALMGAETTELQKINKLISEQPNKYKDIYIEGKAVAEILRDVAATQDLAIQQVYRNIEAREIELERATRIKNIETERLATADAINAKYKLLSATSNQQREAINQAANRARDLNEIARSTVGYREKELYALTGGQNMSRQQIALAEAYGTRLEANIKLYDEQQAQRLKLAEADDKIARDFSAGWEEAWSKYKEAAERNGDAARNMFERFTSSIEDAIVSFVQTGKLSFKDLANTLIAEFTRIQAKRLIAGLFDGGGATGIGNIFSFLTGRATGGPVTGNTPYLVGERGPELFVPSTAGNIVNNNRLGAMGGSGVTQVTYNINATDAVSFRQMLAREPEFLYAVTERGRNNLPVGSRR